MDTPSTGEIWHLSIEDLLEPLREVPRLGGSGPFVINLCASSAPIGQPTQPFPCAPHAHIYQIQRLEDRRLRYRLRLGPFVTEDEADVVLAAVRDVYPSALTATADADDLRSIAALKPKTAPPAAAQPAAAQPAAAQPAVVQPAVAPRAAAAPSAPEIPVAARIPVLCDPVEPPRQPKLKVGPVSGAQAVTVPPATARAPVAAPPPAAAAPIAAVPPAATVVPVVTAPPAAAASPAPRAAAPAPVGPPTPVRSASSADGSPRPPAAPVRPAAARPSVAARAPAAAPASLARPSAVRATAAPSLEATQTLRPLTLSELQGEGVQRWFVIQLSVSGDGFDPDDLPNLDIFNEYRLYSVTGFDQGRIMHSLRLGFFTDETAAAVVASYLAGFYEQPAVKRISAAERERFRDQRVEARKDIGATGKHAVIEITSERHVREKRPAVVTLTPVPLSAAPNAAHRKGK